jgi:DNA-binding NarL/FixJ family response regulator
MKLSPRQEQIAQLLADGKTPAYIGGLLAITEGSVRNHIARSLKKKGLKTTLQLVIYVHKKRTKQNLYIKDTQPAT